jgi:hypothetical protein
MVQQLGLHQPGWQLPTGSGRDATSSEDLQMLVEVFRRIERIELVTSALTTDITQQAGVLQTLVQHLARMEPRLMSALSDILDGVNANSAKMVTLEDLSVANRDHMIDVQKQLQALVDAGTVDPAEVASIQAALATQAQGIDATLATLRGTDAGATPVTTDPAPPADPATPTA